MKYGLSCIAALTAAWFAGSPANALVLVNEDFESYADTNALYSVWTSTGTQGTLVDETFQTIVDDTFELNDVGSRAFPTPETGQAVEHLGGAVLEYSSLSSLYGGTLVPTATQSIVLQGDIFDVAVTGNKRLSIGLRNGAENIIEIGHWNESPVEFAHRAILFPEPSVRPEPNWQFYELDPALDRDDDADEITTLADIGEAWHTHRAIIGVDTITYEIDLYRDGINNATGEPGIDASATYDVVTSDIGYESLRFGGPSNSSSGGNGIYGGALFDNILLEVVDNNTPLVGDYNGDGAVNAADYTVWRDTLGSTTDLRADGNGNLIVDGPAGVGSDYELWTSNYGSGGSSTASSTAIPEPSAVLLVTLGALACGMKRRV